MLYSSLKWFWYWVQTSVMLWKMLLITQVTHGWVYLFCLSLLLRNRRKVYHILLNKLLAVTSKRTQRHVGYISPLILRLKRDFLCVCVCVCALARGCILYPIATKFGTQVGLVKSKVKFEGGLCNYAMLCKLKFE